MGPLLQLDPVFTDEFMAMAAALYKSGVMSPKEVELLSIALDASVTHMYAPGTRRHIKNALKAGATMEEIMEVLAIALYWMWRKGWDYEQSRKFGSHAGQLGPGHGVQ